MRSDKSVAVDLPVPVPARIRLLVFDVDGTLRRAKKLGHVAPRDEDDWELLPRTKEVLSMIDGERSRQLALATHQPDIGRGNVSEPVARRLLDEMLVAAIGRSDVIVELCTKAKSECAKPAPMLLQRAMVRAGAEPDTTWMIGNRSDRKAAKRAGVTFVEARTFFGRRRPPWRLLAAAAIAGIAVSMARRRTG